MPILTELHCPLFTDWTDQYVTLPIADLTCGAAVALRIDGELTPFQFTGKQTCGGAEIMVKLGFAKDQTRQLVFEEVAACTTDLSRRDLPWTEGTQIGFEGAVLELARPSVGETTVCGPLRGFGSRGMTGTISCETPLKEAMLEIVADGPVYRDYRLTYGFAGRRVYRVTYRCFVAEPWVEVSERCGLGMHGAVAWSLNPEGAFDAVLCGERFEGENQPGVIPLGGERPNDVLCRLQMPVLSEYFIPNNHGWFAFFNQTQPEAGMLGMLGLYGARWQQPVDNVVEVLDQKGELTWQAKAENGSRHWLLYAGPLETQYTTEKRLIFHQLHAELNALRLDEHLDLTGSSVWDESCWQEPGMVADDDMHAAARQRATDLKCLGELQADSHPNARHHRLSFDYLIDPSAANREALYAYLDDQFTLWVRQFQGWRTHTNDYQKNVIGFSRYLRGMLIAYEILRRDEALTDEQTGRLNAYFAFAARRILDEGRWPHSRTALHPDHPESMRDTYTYGGEHKPDRLYWTNSLPNFQGDPMCALAHLSALFKDHPDALYWQRFALDDLEHQLDAYCGKSGAWEESINYALYSFSYFVITFRAVKNRLGIDYFNDARVRRMAGWLCRFFGPYDKRFGQYTWPAIGNSILPSGGAEYMLAYAAELPEDDPLRHACIAIFQAKAEHVQLREHYPATLALMGFKADRNYPLLANVSELMDEVGVAMRDRAGEASESYLFQKMGFAKDHYEGDETAFNWYAKGTPLAMDYGTYTGDISPHRAHNLVEIPDEDSLRRGYLAGHLFSDALDYTHCEVPVTLKLLWGRVRDFPEVDGQDGKVNRDKTLYNYIGDQNPVGPKTWKTRLLMFVKPDYLVIFDRVYGDVPHRYNLHLTAEGLTRAGQTITGQGRFDLDPLVYVQHPKAFDHETDTIVPNLRNDNHPEGGKPHRQEVVRVYNRQDGIYRTLVFAQERERDVRIESLGEHGLRVVTATYTDLVFVHNEVVHEVGDGYEFYGRSGWIRQTADGQVMAVVPDGDLIAGFGRRLEGRGPWTWNLAGQESVKLTGGAPREITVL